MRLSVRRARDFVADNESRLSREFPDLFFDWLPCEDGLYVETLSRSGTRSRTRIGHPVDLDRVRAGAQRHIDADRERDAIADRLVAKLGGYHPKAAHVPYVLRWLVLTQQATVEFGDHPDVQPVFRSPCVALVRTPAGRLKVWHDGAAVLHYNVLPPDSSERRESAGLDLRRLTLREFQARWLPPDRPTAMPDIESALDELRPDSSVAVALRLLVQYDDAAWVRHHRFVDDALDPSAPGRVNWAAADRISAIHTEATLQDRAVLAIACHLAGEVTPDVSLADALHHVGAGRQAVMDAFERLAGNHPHPDLGWPVDCPTCS